MKKMSLEEIKKIELDMLKYLKKICDDNKLTYFLCGGTLLGAIRHQGFIPWDDDIDILMPQEDYIKLFEIFKNNINYDILTPYNSKDYYYFFSKIVDKRTVLNEIGLPKIKGMGVYIDIFPLYGLSKNNPEDFMNNVKLEFQNFVFSKWKLYYADEIFLKRLFKMIIYFPKYLFLSKTNWHVRKERILKMIEKYSFKYSEKIAFPLAKYGLKEILGKKVYSKTVNVKFEDEYFSAPIGYDEYLSNLYGDYMKLPPVEKRKTHHHFDAYWKENGVKTK
ncbi:MAG TPA: LicD family protein [Bacilli bacterium]|nr:LicD family protein [Bacilli bacterium]